MINFNNLELVVNEKYSFVGLERRNSQIRFCLPKGFPNKPEELQRFTFNTKRDLFFLLYKVFDQFKNICIEKGYLEENNDMTTSDRDGMVKIHQGADISQDDELDENIFYSKLDMISGILKAHDEPKILSLVYRLGRSDSFDHSQIHKFLHRAVFLPNGAAYIDSMDLPRQQVRFESTDIVAMYCYILWEIKQQLQQEVGVEIKALAEQFKQHYIGGNYGLFEEEYYSQVIDSLKDALELIDHNTPFKDIDYWQFYDAIELFLYGELRQTDEGEIWGIKNFHSVWESMCLTYIVKENLNYLLHLDSRFISNYWIQIFKKSSKIVSLSNDLFKINGSQLVPDAVVFSSILNNIEERRYEIYPNLDWNDQHYCTVFILKLNEDQELKIAHAHQDTGKEQHPFYSLDGYYSLINMEKNHPLYKEKYLSKKGLIIDKYLPQGFFSFWSIESKKIDAEEIYKMYYFRHLFYIYLSNDLGSWDNLQSVDLFENKRIKEIISIQEKFKNINYGRRMNIIKDSLLLNKSCDDINNMLKEFLKSFLTMDEHYINIIDIKYNEISYFLDSRNIEDIKDRSVRKQFVYEYLMQKKLEKLPEHLNKLKVRSSFWLPGYNQKSMFEDGQKFMDGYIRLITVDFEMLAESYVSKETKKTGKNVKLESDVAESYVSKGTKNDKKLTSETKKTEKSIKLESDVKDWKVGDQVFHRTFGIGEVTHVFSNKYKKMSLAIKFGGLSSKILDPNTVPLKRLIPP
ncbi:hypothetical protein L2E69_12640 [Planktothrix agardhii 1806]|jgi:hypothetical protein|uniref:hypothetical protein n=1 Tax=Planktothrix agardhii TaxID=1160 RepID=UPI001F3E11EF|nr:hypothetical protein [Planktothrix agardhii]MCF3571477.1 hypothetical protein [Planktothrix agardhii 1805]MCF3585631.1 hypothetical protein [Planktothrix agardhii 1803]MCF3602308.1 hypothetical protein [Planktothrix agardhii 1804]MCF3616782.1 hypothetical protein [Planktothrix agardhii 1806]CAD5969755.1 hypothetical protein PCC7811_03695 [Planktothrix agardhii]